MGDDRGPVTIIVNPRDRFSTTSRCVDTILERTEPPFDLVLVAGGAPVHLRREWERRYGGRAKLMLFDRLMNQAECRNAALREVGAELAVVIDNDCYVRPGWLEPLVARQRATGAAMVVPLILETPTKIHTAGNDLYVNVRGGARYGHKYLRFHGLPHHDGCELPAVPTAYGELHCQLIEVATALELGVYDDRIIEGGEVDSGLTWAAAGREMWFEPASVVHFDLGGPIDADDLELFTWRWDVGNVRAGYDVFERKWGLDLTEEDGFLGFVLKYNRKVGILPRLRPSARALGASEAVHRTADSIQRWTFAPVRWLYQRAWTRLLGARRWHR